MLAVHVIFISWLLAFVIMPPATYRAKLVGGKCLRVNSDFFISSPDGLSLPHQRQLPKAELTDYFLRRDETNGTIEIIDLRGQHNLFAGFLSCLNKTKSAVRLPSTGPFCCHLFLIRFVDGHWIDVVERFEVVFFLSLCFCRFKLVTFFNLERVKAYYRRRSEPKPKSLDPMSSPSAGKRRMDTDVIKL